MKSKTEILNSELKKIKSDLSRLKLFLILLTTAIQVFFFGFFMNFIPWIGQNLSYNESLVIIALLHYSGIAIFVWYIWIKHPVKPEKKTKDTILIIFLGIIGLWLWLPNENELYKLTNK